MESRTPVVLIGPFADECVESVTTVNRALVQGLAGKYRFVLHLSSRSYGADRQGSLNGVNAFYFLKHLGGWVAELGRVKPDIAHYAVSSGWGMWKGLTFLKVARGLGATTLAHLHSGDLVEHWHSLSAGCRRLASREFNRIGGVVVLSEGWRQLVVSALGLPESKVHVVNNPLDLAFETAALAMPLERLDPMVLSLGVMECAKGAWDILAAAEVVRTRSMTPFVLAGPEREPTIHRRLESFIATRSVQDTVCIRGKVWGERKVELFRKASIFLLPSYFENFPLAVIEAAAAGLAVVTTPVGAIPEFFQDGVSALFVERGNVKQIAAALLWLLDHPEDRFRLGRAAREVFVTRLTRERIMGDMDRVYQTIRSRPRAGRPSTED